MDQVKDKLGEAGIEERRDFGGMLLRARTEEGQTVFMLVSPRDLGQEGEIEVSESDLRKRFEDAGFTNVEVVEGASFALGDLDDESSVIVMRAEDVRDMQSGPASTGTIIPNSPTGVPGGSAPGASPGVTPDLQTDPAVPGARPAPDASGGLRGSNPSDALGGGSGASGTIR